MRCTALSLLILPALLLACHGEPVGPNGSPPVSLPAFAKPGGSGTITDLKLSGSGQDSRAEDINASGRIVGWRGPWNGPNTAFVWTPTTNRGTAGTATTLPSLGDDAQAYAVNAQGYIGGERGRAGVNMQNPVLWRPLPSNGYSAPFELGSALDGGAVLDLGDFGLSNSALAVGHSDIRINPRALAWELSLVSGLVSVSARWVLPSLPEAPGGGSAAFEVSSASQAVGYADSSTKQLPVRWSYDGTAWEIQSLPMLAGATGGAARGINTPGQIVGYNFMGAGACQRAFVWTPPTATAVATLRQLPSLGRSFCETAYAINDAGQVSGSSGGRAVLWILGETISVRDLGKPSGTSTAEGMALNEPLGGTTEIVGYGRSSSGAERGTLWTVR